MTTLQSIHDSNGYAKDCWNGNYTDINIASFYWYHYYTDALPLHLERFLNIVLSARSLNIIMIIGYIKKAYYLSSGEG